MLYVIAYDIPNDRRRKKLADLLESYGDRVQYSVFEADLRNKDYDSMLSRIMKLINTKEDSVRVYNLCASCRKDVKIIGLGRVFKLDYVFII